MRSCKEDGAVKADAERLTQVPGTCTVVVVVVVVVVIGMYCSDVLETSHGPAACHVTITTRIWL